MMKFNDMISFSTQQKKTICICEFPRAPSYQQVYRVDFIFIFFKDKNCQNQYLLTKICTKSDTAGMHGTLYFVNYAYYNENRHFVLTSFM